MNWLLCLYDSQKQEGPTPPPRACSVAVLRALSIRQTGTAGSIRPCSQTHYGSLLPWVEEEAQVTVPSSDTILMTHPQGGKDIGASPREARRLRWR